MKPFKFAPNRVRRLYLGGSGIDRLRNTPNPADNRFPEDWIASRVEATRRDDTPIGHGLSTLEYDGHARNFPDFLRDHADEILGPDHRRRHGDDPALLTKILDSAEQLPMQVHPTREDARRHFGVAYGKTEAWIVLSTREVNGEKPYLLVGFNESLDREVFVRESLAGVYREGLDMLHKIPVKAGDVVMIAGGLPHAIGPGVTMIEVMEPSDLVIVPEIHCCGVELDEKRRFAGLPPQTAMSLFDFAKRDLAGLLAHVTPKKEMLEEVAEGSLERLIPLEKANGCFEAWSATARGSYTPPWPRRTFKIGVVVEGALEAGGLPLRPGDGFLIPHAADSETLIGDGRIIFTLPPAC